jgi:hypothetical protein
MERVTTDLVDDLTGEKLIQSKRVTMLIGVDGKEDEFTLDLDPDTLAALMAAIRDHEWESLRRLFTGEPAKEVKPKPAAKSADDEVTSKQVNDWLKTVGRESEVKHGRISKVLKEEYIAARAT